MNRYEISSPHVDMTLGVVAAAMAAITFSVLVGLPAMSVSANPQPPWWLVTRAHGDGSRPLSGAHRSRRHP